MPTTLNKTTITTEGPPGGAPFFSEPADTITTAEVTKAQILNPTPARKPASTPSFSSQSTNHSVEIKNLREAMLESQRTIKNFLTFVVFPSLKECSTVSEMRERITTANKMINHYMNWQQKRIALLFKRITEQQHEY